MLIFKVAVIVLEAFIGSTYCSIENGFYARNNSEKVSLTNKLLIHLGPQNCSAYYAA